MSRFLTGAMLVLVAAAWGCAPDTDAFEVEDQTQNTDDGGGAGDETPYGELLLSGRLTSTGFGKSQPGAQDAPTDYGQVIAVSSTTLESYTATPNDDGTFEFVFPPEEKGNVFQFVLVGPDGRAAGPIMLGSSNGAGNTGLEMSKAVDFGDIAVPDTPGNAPIAPANTDAFASQIAPDVLAWVDAAGVPVGVPNVGKGDDAQTGQTSDKNVLDRDQDGLIDVFDADDNGNGIVDDFDSTPSFGRAERDGVQINLFMNLKLDDGAANSFYASDEAGIQAILDSHTVITFEVRGTGTLKKNIVGARILDWPAPAPSYLKDMTISGPSGSSLWSASGYAFQPWATNHFQQWAVPNAPIDAGDLFTFEVSFDDGTAARYTRMINFVFRSIPRLVNYGPASSLVAYTGPGVLTIDGSQDLVLEWEPPVDDTGAALVGFTYFFEIFYNDGSGQQVQNVDGAATWPTPIPGFDSNRRVYEVDGSALSSLSVDGTLSSTLPKEIFVDTLQTASGATGVGSYKIDVAAQRSGNNAALMLPADK